MPKKERFEKQQHHKTMNSRGYMHPISSIGLKFISHASHATVPVVDMGCAYGNITIATLEAGANTVIACDMEEGHLQSIRDQIEGSRLKPRLITKQGLFPHGFDFKENSLDAIYASHLLEYLNGNEVDEGLANFYRWLRTGGKLFILCYTIYIRELVNTKFQEEYKKRQEEKMKWPGYLEDFNQYSQLPGNPEAIETEASAFPTALHIYDLPVLIAALQTTGFIIEAADYLDGQSNGAVKDTWYDGREYIGIIAHKP